MVYLRDLLGETKMAEDIIEETAEQEAPVEAAEEVVEETVVEDVKDEKPVSVVPELAPGDTVKVSVRIREGEKERIQVFQGVVIKTVKSVDGGNFTVRRVAYGVGTERTFPNNSPMLAKVEVLRHGKVRRARLFYLRDRSGKAARIKEKRTAK